MHEYDSLRAEAVTRIGARIQFLAFMAASLAFTFGFRQTSETLVLGILLLVVGLLVWLRLTRLLIDLGRHIADVEDRLNRLAAEVGCDSGLLSWETSLQVRRQASYVYWS